MSAPCAQCDHKIKSIKIRRVHKENFLSVVYADYADSIPVSRETNEEYKAKLPILNLVQDSDEKDYDLILRLSVHHLEYLIVVNLIIDKKFRKFKVSQTQFRQNLFKFF